MNAQTTAYHALGILQRASLIDLRNALRMASKNNQDAAPIQAEIDRRLNIPTPA